MDANPNLKILQARGIIVDAVGALAHVLGDRDKTGPDEIHLADQILECVLTYIQSAKAGGLAALERDKIDRATDDLVAGLQQLAIGVPKAINGG